MLKKVCKLAHILVLFLQNFLGTSMITKAEKPNFSKQRSKVYFTYSIGEILQEVKRKQ